MNLKTNFSFELQYPAHSDTTLSERNEVMDSLQASLQELLAPQDSAAAVAVSDSHKGSGHKIVELTTTLQDAQIVQILKSFSAKHGVVVSALE
jgi:hypothetical protein